MNCIWISLFCQFINLWSARIAKSDRTGHFIKCFSGRIVSGASEDFVFSVIFYHNQVCMSSGYYQACKRRLQIRMFNIICRNMPFYMVHTYQRQIFSIADRLCLGYSDKQSPHQSRSIGNRDRIQIIQCDVCFFKSFCDDLIYFFNMLS